MAITRAQQVKQMLRNGGVTEDINFSIVKPSTTGKRPGYRRSNYDGSGGGFGGAGKSGGPSGGSNNAPGDGGGGNISDRDASRNRVAAATNTKSMQKAYGVTSQGLSPSQKQARQAGAEQRAGTQQSIKDQGGGGGGLKDLFGKTIIGKTLNMISNSKLAQMNNLKQRQNYLSYLSRTNPSKFQSLAKSLVEQGLATADMLEEDDSITSPSQRFGATDFSSKSLNLNEGLGSPDFKDAFGEGYQTYLDRFDIPENKQGGDNTGIATPLWAQLGFNSEAEYLASLNPATTTPTPSTRNFGGLAPRFAGSIFDFTGMAEGGRAGFQTGGSSGVSMQNTLAQNIAANNAQAVANQKARGAISALLSSKISNTSPATTTASMPSPSSMASTPSPSPMASTSSSSSQMTPSSTPSSGTGGFTVNTPTGTTTFNSPGNFGVQGVMIDGKIYYSEQDAINDLGIVRYNQLMADGGRAGYMDGGMTEEDDPVGGIMDLESGRQMYFLGKLVKKATRAVKKVVKSPLGKAALLGAIGFGIPGTGLGGIFGRASFGGAAPGMFGFGGIKNAALLAKGNLLGQAGSRVGQSFVPYKEGLLTKLGITKGGGSLMPTLKGGITLGLGIPAALDYLGVGKEKEEDDFDVEEYYKTQGIDIDAIRNNPYRFLARRFVGMADGGRINYQEGGDAEPVAKKTMPLIDMDGKEKDYRETGGFVDMGRMERADDVPARLSKNEFVFTADAVRNAGEGNIDKGAEVMYNMMKNLESGGEVSEESQGLDGAREMFKTSQRLEEVL